MDGWINNAGTSDCESVINRCIKKWTPFSRIVRYLRCAFCIFMFDYCLLFVSLMCHSPISSQFAVTLPISVSNRFVWHNTIWWRRVLLFQWVDPADSENAGLIIPRCHVKMFNYPSPLWCCPLHSTMTMKTLFGAAARLLVTRTSGWLCLSVEYITSRNNGTNSRNVFQYLCQAKKLIRLNESLLYNLLNTKQLPNDCRSLFQARHLYNLRGAQCHLLLSPTLRKCRNMICCWWK